MIRALNFGVSLAEPKHTACEPVLVYDLYISALTARVLVEWNFKDSSGKTHSGICRTINDARIRAEHSSKEVIHDDSIKARS